MLDLQSALNVGDGFFFESEQWMEDELVGQRRELDVRPDWPIFAIEPEKREACIIDPLLGTSVKLLSVMVTHKNLGWELIVGASSSIVSILETCTCHGSQYHSRAIITRNNH
jgi:hypothetical protein